MTRISRKQFLKNLKSPYYAQAVPRAFLACAASGGGRCGACSTPTARPSRACIIAKAAAQGGGESLTTNGAFGILAGRAVTEDLGAA